MSKPLSSLDSTQTIDTASNLADKKKTGTFKDFLEICKTGIVNSNLVTTFTGIWLALKLTDQLFLDNLVKIILVLAGAALVIAGGCCLNNFIDRDIDQLMERTRERPSATGTLIPRQVLWAGIIMSTLGTILLFMGSPVSAIFGLIGLFVYVVIYTMWLKRTHSINTIVGGVSGAVPPLIGWAAIDPSLSSMVPWLLFLFMFLWQPPHFLALALKRVEEYRRAGIPMLPVVAGFEVTKRQMIIYVAALIPASLMLYELGTVYLIAAGILGIAWLIISIAGFYTKDIIKWSRIMFVFSLNYMTILFIVMIISVLF
ncbi:protoheme IX farnesyltransferase [Pullulanibacillus pueri]|uniref:Protoheme IX farnesyltransferase n=1 Tax=Pullulanibacillus pueri TaxID=1437324 RepID=A0A8J2ZRW5_9BACL|nr:heme o synthase [Pullulanibacillus pueri]MBM7680097.1 protoheme IX farnesyltransferase [Pullulanibacillus pueri]GGH74354.1 protoheme IX farnesyltransferase 2 [Pullulanibacillus pueri]